MLWYNSHGWLVCQKTISFLLSVQDDDVSQTHVELPATVTNPYGATHHNNKSLWSYPPQ